LSEFSTLDPVVILAMFDEAVLMRPRPPCDLRRTRFLRVQYTPTQTKVRKRERKRTPETPCQTLAESGSRGSPGGCPISGGAGVWSVGLMNPISRHWKLEVPFSGGV
jgi:hypothetical protein